MTEPVTTDLRQYVKIGILKIGTRLGICFGLLIVMMLIANMRFATGGEINSRINATTWAVARRTIVPLAATDKKTISEVLATLDKLIDLFEGLVIAPIANTRAS